MYNKRFIFILASAIGTILLTLACTTGAVTPTEAPVVIPTTAIPPTATATAVPPTATVAPPPDLAAGLVAWYPFNGDVLDASGNGHDGETSEPVFVAAMNGDPNAALSFSGAWTMVVVPDAPALDLTGSFTISMVLQGGDDTSHQWLLLSKHTAGQCQPAKPSWFLRFDHGAGGLFFSQYDQTAECGTHIAYGTLAALADGAWHTVVVTYDQPAQELSFYLDCQAIYQQTQALGFQDNDRPLVIGNQYQGPASTNFVGAMDDLRLYDRVVAPDVLQALCTGE